MREPSRLELVHGDRRLGAAGLVPDAEPHMRVIVDVARHAEHAPPVARMRSEELDVLPAERRRAPGAEAEALLDLAPAMRAGVHSRSLH